jgi:hypothetical protein
MERNKRHDIFVSSQGKGPGRRGDPADGPQQQLSDVPPAPRVGDEPVRLRNVVGSEVLRDAAVAPAVLDPRHQLVPDGGAAGVQIRSVQVVHSLPRALQRLRFGALVRPPLRCRAPDGARPLAGRKGQQTVFSTVYVLSNPSSWVIILA